MKYIKYLKILFLPKFSDKDYSNFNLKFLNESVKKKYNIKEIVILTNSEKITKENSSQFKSTLYISTNTLIKTLKYLSDFNILIFLIPGNYIFQNEKIIGNYIKILSFKNNSNIPEISILQDFTIICKKAKMEYLKFNINKSGNFIFKKKYIAEHPSFIFSHFKFNNSEEDKCVPFKICNDNISTINKCKFK